MKFAVILFHSIKSIKSTFSLPLAKPLSHIFISTTFHKMPATLLQAKKEGQGGTDPNVNAMPRLAQIPSLSPSAGTQLQSRGGGFFVFGGRGAKLVS